jgi:hypothetical protein
VNLDPQTIELLADAIAERLSEQRLGERWLTAEEVARHVGVDVGFVYEHSERLGARRLGDGPKARLRFRIDLVEASLCVAGRESVGPPTAAIRPRRTRRRPPHLGSGVELLPIRGSREPIA